MTHIQTVRETLLATAQIGSVINSSMVSTAPDDALQLFATCVDRTSLERRFRLTLSDTTEITVDARNRRLVRFSATSNANSGHAHGQEVPETLCTSEDAMAVAQHLRALLDGHSIMRLHFVDDPAIVFPTTSGVSAAVILQCLDQCPRPPAPIDLEALLTGLIENATAQVLGACVLTSEDIFVIVGSDEQVLAMVDWAKPVLGACNAARSDASCKFQSGGICALNWGGPNPTQLLIVNAAQKTGLVLVDTDQGADFLSAMGPYFTRGA